MILITFVGDSFSGYDICSKAPTIIGAVSAITGLLAGSFGAIIGGVILIKRRGLIKLYSQLIKVLFLQNGV